MKKAGLIIGVALVTAWAVEYPMAYSGERGTLRSDCVSDSADVSPCKESKPGEDSVCMAVRRTVVFSDMERNHVRVQTPNIFGDAQSFLLRMDSIGEGEYCFPLPGAKVISAYGARRGHSGADLKTKPNDTVRCAFDGVVRMAKPYAAYGNVVVVRHGNGLESVYSHNSKNLVKSGDWVKAGQPIGLTGRTGKATTEHLHFELRVNGCHFNPDIIFNLHDGTLRKETFVCSKLKNGVEVKTLK